ncbi:hypothetical protein RFI_22530 [Reticulomyxa filosa]|uniref:Uncharacterized protein n=1 Tax=Reticulomyxa filosa TaxID=46433 RepID=X6MP38_RETFI|nr:hypothetical protein RFI_22530 [Reticulomyxa filosa]|eukprot:ETO14840.1 hypothetical protein RFI_22530 [Reticulomyxa filosa]
MLQFKQTNKKVICYLFNIGLCFTHRYGLKPDIPRKVWMSDNEKWEEYEIVFDYACRRIVLFEPRQLKVKTLQVGNPKQNSSEFDIDIEYYNDFSAVRNTHTKWCGLILNQRWHFRMLHQTERDCFSDFCSQFNSFKIRWKDNKSQIREEPLNPKKTTLKQGFQRLKKKLKAINCFNNGTSKLILFECEFAECEPRIFSDTDTDKLLYDIYQHIYDKNICWKVSAYFMVPYKYTIDITKIPIPQNANVESTVRTTKKQQFNPLLYEHDIPTFTCVQTMVYSNPLPSKNEMKNILHETIKNGYLCDLIQEKQEDQRKIKQCLHFNENNIDALILNDNILRILRQVKQLYHSAIHKHMRYPLHLHHICAILLYGEKLCSVQFCYDQLLFKHDRWKYLDLYLHQAISILHKHERREENSMELYCGLKDIKVNIKKIEKSFFISHVSTSDDLKLAQIDKGNQGCILTFHPSMRRASGIESCDISWMFPYKYKREILFSRSFINISDKNPYPWDANIENEDENTQTIVLTWKKYNQFIQQIMHISMSLNHFIDLNLIYLILDKFESDVSEAQSWQNIKKQ